MEKTITVPSGYVLSLLQQVKKQGYDLSELLSELGIDPSEIEMRTEFSAVKFGQLYQRIMWTSQDESFGMLSGGRVPNGTFRMMCHAIIHCLTLERAIWRCSSFYEICRGTKVKPSLVRKGRFAKISFAPVSTVPEAEVKNLMENQIASEIRTGLSMWHHFISWLIGTRLDLKAAYFNFPQPDDAYHYETLFQSEIKFDQHDNAIVFPARYLDYPIVQNDETLRGFLQTAPYQLIVMVDNDQTLTSQVVALLGKDFSRELPGAEDVAFKLNMSVSTLRRRLADEDSSYQKIKDECRKKAAINYMDSPQLSINDVAALMGFDEPSAFFRSFKKWTGMTPGEYRKSETYGQKYALGSVN
ncbi:AraC family transcriptional regulator [Amphritea balenae]|uniref:AraC family transcriptional regulator n=1 Tax=Amphritea balenae TaxID=452629 RepID=A0A3P1SST7_9GAMM|nr:AraC family transcriptional regulator [Amphritea balenae]RRC99675.1 AraC family transcriptional regulator [Amphritea balenae]